MTSSKGVSRSGLSRRRFALLVGGGAVFAAAAGGGAFVMTRRPNTALAPWEAAGAAPYAEPRMRALSYAVLAPNPHNRQPWLVELRGENEIILTVDLGRRLPATDPQDRQITIGLGCFLELLRLAAAEDGRAADISVFPEGEGRPRLDGRPVARIRLGEPGSAAPDPLFQHVLARRSTKEPYDLERPVSETALTALEGAAGPGVRAAATAAAGPVAALRALTWDAWRTEAATPAAHRESVDLMRFGKAEINASPDGIDLGGPFLEALMLAGVMNREALLDPTSSASAAGADIYREMLAATPAYLWLATAGNRRADQVAAGQAWVRINLAATAAGLSLHPVSQCLQEFPEMAEHYRAAHALMGEAGETVQMLGRVGYGPAQAASPRWPVETRLVT